MFIGTKEIAKLLSGYDVRLICGDESACLTGFQFLDSAPAPFSDHILYLAEKLPPSGQPNYLLLLPEKKKNEICTVLQNYFLQCSGDALFTDTLFQILTSGGSVQDMTDRAFLAMQNPIYVFDAGFNLVAAATDGDALSQDEYSRRIIENQGFSAEDYQMASRDRNLHKRVLRSNSPIESFNKTLGFSQLLCAVNPDRDLGHIVVNAVRHPFTVADRRFLQTFRMALKEKYQKDEFLRQNQGTSIEYYLKDLLDGKIVTAKRYRDRMDFFKEEFSCNLYCLVVEVARSSSATSARHVCQLFSFLFPRTILLVHNGQVIILLRIPKDRELSKREYDTARKLCIDNGLFAGLSNRFSKILHFQDYWRQALRAIELGIETTNSPELFRYQDYYLHHLANLFLQKESASIYCHPALKCLDSYDAENHSELANTLYVWLKCERNSSLAAAQLDVHRNTMLFRLKQINELVSLDFGDYQERQYLLLSFELRQIQKKVREGDLKNKE